MTDRPQSLRDIAARAEREGRTVKGRDGKRRAVPPARAKNAYARRGMNKTEARYALLLEAAKEAGDVVHYGFEEVTLTLAARQDGLVRYTPDFHVVRADGAVEFHEVKGGFIREDADTKFRVACDRYPFYRFLLVQQKSAKRPFVTLKDSAQ